MIVWDYQLKRGWKPKTDFEWRWYLERNINYDNWKGLDVKKLRQFLSTLKIPPAKRLLIKAFLKRYAQKKS